MVQCAWNVPLLQSFNVMRMTIIYVLFIIWRQSVHWWKKKIYGFGGNRHHTIFYLAEKEIYGFLAEIDIIQFSIWRKRKFMVLAEIDIIQFSIWRKRKRYTVGGNRQMRIHSYMSCVGSCKGLVIIR